MTQDDPNVTILRALLEGEGSFVSGSRIARELGISRVGVWSRLEKLREGGFTVEAVRNRGYRLVEEPESFSPELVTARTELAGADIPIHFFPEIDSTNSEGERQLAAGRAVPFVVASCRQTAGRGRMGRRWHSPDEGNLYLSFVFRPQLAPSAMQAFTVWSGASICECLATNLDLPVRVKWPNDLLVDGRKVGGILTEARIDADRTRDLILGLGLNLNCRCARWPPEIRKIATSLRDAAGRTLSLNRVAAQLVTSVNRAYHEFVEDRYRDRFESLWHRYDALSGKLIEYTEKQTLRIGIANGIDPGGGLRVLRSDGSTAILVSGEVSLGSGTYATSH